jgi:hypothetical protein
MAGARKRQQLHPHQRDASQGEIAVVERLCNKAKLCNTPTQCDRDAVAGAKQPFKDRFIARPPSAERVTFKQRHV